MTERRNQFKVLIAGGGTAALEAALALRELAGDRVTTTLLSPEAEFVYRPLRVREPFAGPAAHHYSLAEFARHCDVTIEKDSFKWLDPTERVVHTAGGQQFSYDALLLAMGARPRPRFKHAMTLDDRLLDEQLHGLIQDIEAGYVHRLAFIAPSQTVWPLPLYELALLTAHRAYEMNEDASVTLVSSEDAPLAVFGDAVSEAVLALLDEARIRFIPSEHAETPEPGEVALHPSGQSLHVDRVIALPELFGPSTPGVPKHDGQGFVSVDEQCRVRGLDGVYAAGDITDYPIKYGGIAALQADTAAASIARMAGAPIEQPLWSPDIHATLLGGKHPLHLIAHITGSHGSGSVVTGEPAWSGAKIAARYLTPYLQSQDRAGATAVVGSRERS